MSELKPCPFCGCEYDKDEEDYYYSGEHEKWCPLGNQGNIYKSNFLVGHSESEVEAWNTRANECDCEALLELADDLEQQQRNKGVRMIGNYMEPGVAALRIRKALEENDAN